ncbi:MAG: hypothetical protein RSC43_00275 [Clostridia bacterium]
MSNETKTIIMIDGDNVNFTYYKPFLSYLASTNIEIAEVHLFGKLASKYVQDWKAFLHPGSIFMECPVTANRKNSTDIQLISMICQKYHIEGFRHFCLLSSDSDFGYIATTLPENCKLIVGYCGCKVASSYVKFLRANKIQAVDLDLLRGPITGQLKTDMVNTILKSYLEFKLSENFFDYATLTSWLRHRFGDTCVASPEEVQSLCKDKRISFSPAGVIIEEVLTPEQGVL